MKRWFKRLAKTTAAFGAACAVLACGAGVMGYAFSIPGVTRPYDPPNYYSLTTVSEPDSAPSPFALRDLAAQGGNVYDYTRHIKSILYDTKFASWLEILTGKNKVEEDNSAQLTDEQKRQGAIAYLETMNALQVNWTQREENPAAFDSKNYDGTSGRDLDYRETSAYLSDGYESAAAGAQNRSAINDKLASALASALQNSNNAIGETQAYQSGAQIEAAKQLAVMALTQAVGAQTDLRNLHQMQSTADRQAQYDMQSNGRALFLDPSDPNDKRMLDSYAKDMGYTPYESKPMPDF